MDESEFRRRIEVYLRADLPNVPQAARIAEVLAARLYQYVRQPSPNEVTRTSSVLEALFPPDGVLFFGASWDGHTLQYRQTVQEAGRRLGRQVIEIDVDDLVGSAVATMFGVGNIPAVARAGLPASDAIIGVPAVDDLVSFLSD